MNGVGTVSYPQEENNGGSGGFPTDAFPVSVANGSTFGKYENGDMVPAFQNVNELLAAWRETLLPFIKTNPSLSLTGAPSQVEIGTRINAQLARTFNRGLIKSRNGAADIPLLGASTGVIYSGPGVNVNTGLINHLAGTRETLTYQAVESHAAGTGIYYDSAGAAASNLNDDREAGTLNASDNTAVRYKIFRGTGTAYPANSAELRAGAETWDNQSTVNLDTGTVHKFIWIAIPVALENAASVNATDTSNANATVPYQKIGVVSVVCGTPAENFTVDYNVYGINGASGLGSPYPVAANHRFNL